MNNKEHNPYLGWRGIRMLLDEEEMLQQQLKAICKTAAGFKGRIRILIPMVSTLEELHSVRQLLTSVQEDLEGEGIDIDANLPLGIMVEVPNVALQADLFAEHADFMSIGTNDLTQYVLAVDRGNERISHLYNQCHPSIWQLIKRVTTAAERFDTPLGLCGELASNPVAASCPVGMGISNLSMNPAALPEVKKMLRAHSRAEMHELSRRVLECNTMGEVNTIFSDWKNT